MISVDTLPDDVLVEIFHHCVNDDDVQDIMKGRKSWQSLVHVCRRWRSIIFASPRHLKLRLVCTEGTPARDMLDIWPALPLVIRNYYSNQLGLTDNVIAALERRDRVCRINLDRLSSSDMEMFLAAMQRPFPELTHLLLRSFDETVSVVPDSFLGGSAPRLRFLMLSRIPCPGLPKLLLSATHLTHLHLLNIPHSGYFSPDMIVTALSALTSLENLSLGFQSPRSCPDQASRRPPPSTRSVLPILEYFRFTGVTEYLEDLVARIDAPRLNTLEIAFFNDIAFDTPQFIQFILRTAMSRALEKARIILQNPGASLHFSPQTSDDRKINVKIQVLCQGLEWQVSSLDQVCTSCLPPLAMVEDLYIYVHSNWPPNWKDEIENGQWLEPLHPFTAVKNLYLSEEMALPIGSALQELTDGSTTEVLPNLQNIFLEGLESSGPVQEGIAKFVAVRQVASRPIAVSGWANSNRDKVDPRFIFR